MFILVPLFEQFSAAHLLTHHIITHSLANINIEARTFAPIVSAHPYCALGLDKFCS